MSEFWESSFRDKQAMWGFEPADSARDTVTLFRNRGMVNILIPGFGYGRNAKVFADNGFSVTGIEISQTAIDLARQHFGPDMPVFQGSVSDMPFDQVEYDGIFCYALIHLLSKKDRLKLIADCYNQLKPGGLMVFVAISVRDARYGQGKEVSKNRFLTGHGVELFFYDSDSIEEEFGKYGLSEALEIKEPVHNRSNISQQQFWKIVCEKIEVEGK